MCLEVPSCYSSLTPADLPVQLQEALLLLEDHFQPGDHEVCQQQCSPKSKELLVVKVMDGLATDYFMTSWDPDLFRWYWERKPGYKI